MDDPKRTYGEMLDIAKKCYDQICGAVDEVNKSLGCVVDYPNEIEVDDLIFNFVRHSDTRISIGARPKFKTVPLAIDAIPYKSPERLS